MFDTCLKDLCLRFDKCLIHGYGLINVCLVKKVCSYKDSNTQWQADLALAKSRAKNHTSWHSHSGSCGYIGSLSGVVQIGHPYRDRHLGHTTASHLSHFEPVSLSQMIHSGAGVMQIGHPYRDRHLGHTTASHLSHFEPVSLSQMIHSC